MRKVEIKKQTKRNTQQNKETKGGQNKTKQNTNVNEAKGGAGQAVRARAGAGAGAEKSPAETCRVELPPQGSLPQLPEDSIKREEAGVSFRGGGEGVRGVGRGSLFGVGVKREGGRTGSLSGVGGGQVGVRWGSSVGVGGGGGGARV